MDSQPGAGAGDSETMKIVFWFNLALHRIQLGRYKLICPCSLNSIFLFISTLHISNRLDLRILLDCLAAGCWSKLRVQLNLRAGRREQRVKAQCNKVED